MREATNPLVAVQMVIDDWTRADMGDECFWEDWPECPTECLLTPNIVKAAINQQAAAIAELVEALEMVRDGNAGCQPGYVNTMTLQRVSNLIAKHKAKP